MIGKLKYLILGSCLMLGSCLLLLGACNSSSPISPRERSDFNADWRFHLGDGLQAAQPGFADNDWRVLNLPHDWAIEGDFSRENPSGTGGGALPGGVGWYRKTFSVDKADIGKIFRIEFDGVYMNSEVFINGVSLGVRPYGYISFSYNLTPYLKWDEPNVLAVRVDNAEQPNSRWYSGCGIYRNVWLSKTGPIHVADWGTYVTTSSVDKGEAVLNLVTTIVNESDTNENITVCSSLQDAEGREVAGTRSAGKTETGRETVFAQQLTVKQPELWDIDTPYLYTLVTEVMRNEECMDRYTTPVGIRTFSFDARKGFTLNGRQTKINGVCMHHDLGCLGAVVNTRAIERQLQILKEMGCNGIRCSHNPPAPELLDLCDRMGFIVMDEAFDMWRKKKTAHDYARYFNEWHERDLNVTAGCNEPNSGNHLFRSGALDMIGYNYHNKDIPHVPANFPDKPFIITESNSALMTRGYYRMPSDRMFIWPERWDKPFADSTFACSSYENCHVPWGNTHEESLKLVRDNDFISGQYVWTGFDYIGEPTPYGWPARSSFFGIIDLAGFPKDVYYLYQSEWTDKQVLHLFPHWNWTPGQEIDMWCYYNQADEVELFVNGKSQGVKCKDADNLHVVWRVKFEPGTVKVVARRKDEVVAEKEIRTAGKPAEIRLTPDRSVLAADGKDLCFVTVEVLDEEGNLCPNADNLVNFTVKGNGFIAGVDNGNPVSLERFKDKKRKAFCGKCLVVIQNDGKPGKTELTATSEGLRQAVVKVSAKDCKL